jgi:uncharacterized protein YcbK (DUF882 family)
MGDLSPHFSEYEFACQHCGLIKLDPALVPALEDLRMLAGGKPIKIHDAYRCEVHNAQVGGAPQSEHETGSAADLEIEGLSLKEMLAAALRNPAFGGIGLYPDEGFIHVDVRERFARWARVAGKYVSYQEGITAMFAKDHEGGEKNR